LEAVRAICASHETPLSGRLLFFGREKPISHEQFMRNNPPLAYLSPVSLSTSATGRGQGVHLRLR
jgi:hypothetical protein